MCCILRDRCWGTRTWDYKVCPLCYSIWLATLIPRLQTMIIPAWTFSRTAKLAKEHANFQYSAVGLHVNTSYPHLGAGIINCDCCGDGVINWDQVPLYKHRDKHPHHVADPQFYLKRNNDGELHLCRDHEYYSQIQGQLAVCEKEYCDFCVLDPTWHACGMHSLWTSILWWH